MEKKTKTPAIKAFNSDWTCYGFQYEVGKTYTHDGDINLCSSGFHACPADKPFAVWDYYPPISSDCEFARYAEVTLGDVKSDGDKFVSASISVDVELLPPDFIKRAVAAIKGLGAGGERRPR